MDFSQFILIALGMILTYKLLKGATFVDNKKLQDGLKSALFMGAKSIAEIEEPYLKRLQKAIDVNDDQAIQDILNELNNERKDLLSKDVEEFIKFIDSKKQ